MSPRDPNLAQVELIAHVLGSLREELVFVGGCAVGLLMSDPAASPARVTYDVDLVVEVASLLSMPEFMNYLSGLLHQDATLPERVAEVAVRLRRIGDLG